MMLGNADAACMLFWPNIWYNNTKTNTSVVAMQVLHSDLAKASTRLFVQLAQSTVDEAVDFQKEQHQNRLRQEAAKQVVVGMAEMLKIANALPGDSALVKEQCQDLLDRQIRAQAEFAQLEDAAEKLEQQKQTFVARVAGFKNAVLKEVEGTLQAVMDSGLAGQS